MPTCQHSFELAVRSYELDSYAHVNNGAYLAWFEDGRERFLRTEGRSYAFFPEELGLLILVVNIDCDFLASAVGGDELCITTRLAHTGRTSIAFRQIARRTTDGALCARARVVMVFADRDSKPSPIPKSFLDDHGVDPLGDVWADTEERPRV